MFFDFFDCIALKVEGDVSPFFGRLFAQNKTREKTRKYPRRITIAADEQFKPTGIFLSRSAAFSDDVLYLADSSRKWVAISLNEAETAFTLRYQPGFDGIELSKVMEWGLHILASHEGLAFVHSMGYATPEGAIVCPAWLNTGKTKTLMRLLATGNAYIGDDWTVISNAGLVWAYPKVPFIYIGDLREIYQVVTQALGWKERLVARVEDISGLSGRAGRWLKRLARRALGVSLPMLLPVSDLTDNVLGHPVPLRRLVYLTRCDVDRFALSSLPRPMWQPRLMQVYRYEHGLFISPYIFAYAFPARRTLNAHYDQVARIVSQIDWRQGILLRIPRAATSADIATFLRKEGLSN